MTWTSSNENLLALVRLERERRRRRNARVFTPAALMEQAGLYPDPWQRAMFESQSRRVLLLCSRQSGKSTSTAAMMLAQTLSAPKQLALLVCPAERQSKEYLHDKVMPLYEPQRATMPAVSESTLHLELANGSRIIALPGNETTLRGYSGAALIVLDEAARIPDSLYYSLRPVLAVSGGRLLAMSTPFGKRGWFHEEYTEGGGDWDRVKITAEECPRITPAFLAEERRRLPKMWYDSEYGCEFTETVDSVFSYEDIQAALADDVQPLFGAAAVEQEEGDYATVLW